MTVLRTLSSEPSRLTCALFGHEPFERTYAKRKLCPSSDVLLNRVLEYCLLASADDLQWTPKSGLIYRKFTPNEIMKELLHYSRREHFTNPRELCEWIHLPSSQTLPSPMGRRPSCQSRLQLPGTKKVLNSIHKDLIIKPMKIELIRMPGETESPMLCFVCPL